MIRCLIHGVCLGWAVIHVRWPCLVLLNQFFLICQHVLVLAVAGNLALFAAIITIISISHQALGPLTIVFCVCVLISVLIIWLVFEVDAWQTIVLRIYRIDGLSWLIVIGDALQVERSFEIAHHLHLFVKFLIILLWSIQLINPDLLIDLEFFGQAWELIIGSSGLKRLISRIICTKPRWSVYFKWLLFGKVKGRRRDLSHHPFSFWRIKWFEIKGARCNRFLVFLGAAKALQVCHIMFEGESV